MMCSYSADPVSGGRGGRGRGRGGRGPGWASSEHGEFVIIADGEYLFYYSLCICAFCQQ